MKCHHFIQKHCLSCDLLAEDYVSTIASKEQKLRALFPESQDKIKASVLNDLGVAGSRNKAKLAVASVNGHIEFGFYDQFIQFKKLEDCPLHASSINETLVAIKDQLNFYDIEPYDVKLKKGELKYLLITYSESTNALLIRFVLRSKESLPLFRSLTASLISLYSQVKVVTANIQSKHQAILEGDEEIVLTKNDHIAHHFGDYTLFQGPRSFFQTNTQMALKLYQQLQTELSQLSIQSFLDLYCGVGAFSFFAEKHASQVMGVEISDAAISYANMARENNNSHIHFAAMDVEVYLKNLQEAHYDAVMVNPPRRGLNETIISSLINLAPEYLFYSSCNAETLHRDCLQLQSHYQIQSLQIFDMFPFTSHFETLAVLVRK